MHVVHLIDHMGLGGAQNVLVKLLPELRAQGVAVTLVVLRGTVPQAAVLHAAGIAVQQLELGRYNPLQLPVVFRTLLRLKPDILHASLFRAWMLADLYACVDPKVKLILHDHSGPIHDLKAPGWLGGLAAGLQRRLATRVDAYICVSQAVAAHAQTIWQAPRDKTVVIYNPYDEVTITAEQRRQARHSLGIGPDQPVVLALGRLSEEKGHTSLIDAVACLRSQRQALPRILIAGDGPLRSELEARIVRLELQQHIQLLGRRSDTADLLAAADVFVQPSRYEPLSLSVLEAMSAGLPVIGARIGGIPDLIRDNDSGLLVPPNDATALAAALALLIDDEQLRQRLGDSAGRRVRRHFSPEQAVAQTVVCYHTLLGQTAWA